MEEAEAACSYSPSCVGMCDWTACPGVNSELLPPEDSIEPLPSASLKQPLLPQRFDFASEEKLAELAKGHIPANTSKSTKWALKVFELWSTARNQRHTEDPVPEDLFICNNPAVLNVHLSRFAVEARKSNGDYYPPATIHQLLCGLLRHMRDTSPGCPNFLDKQDSRFRQLQGTLDALFHKLHSDGIGVQVKHAEILTKEDEMKLWDSGVMGLTTPRALQNAAFYTVGKMFCLRGGIEHRSLKVSQLQRLRDPDRYIYYENVSKNRNGSFKQLHIRGKVVPAYACPEAGERCPVSILDTYLSKLSPETVEKDLFYVRPLERVPTNPLDPWYASVPVGRDTLRKKLSIMCKQAGIPGNKTNHSLRATSATQLYDSGAPEKLIQERTGHRSLEALRSYERTNAHQHHSASSILSAAKLTPYAAMQQTYASESTRIAHTVTEVQQPPKQEQYTLPGFSFQNLHGCTININTPPPQMNVSPAVTVTDHTEVDIDKLIAAIIEPIQ